MISPQNKTPTASQDLHRTFCRDQDSSIVSFRKCCRSSKSIKDSESSLFYFFASAIFIRCINSRLIMKKRVQSLVCSAVPFFFAPTRAGCRGLGHAHTRLAHLLQYCQNMQKYLGEQDLSLSLPLSLSFATMPDLKYPQEVHFIISPHFWFT